MLLFITNIRPLGWNRLKNTKNRVLKIDYILNPFIRCEATTTSMIMISQLSSSFPSFWKIFFGEIKYYADSDSSSG